MSTDQTLLTAAQHGDRDALVALYERYRDRIYSFVWYRVKQDDQLAEEISAETFARLIKHLPTLHASQKPLLAWLYTVARNSITDQQRRNGKLSDGPLPESLISQLLTPEQAAQISFDAARSVNAMAQLKDSQRNVLILRFLDGMNVAETAETMGIEQGNVKTLTRRGLHKLRQLLAVEVTHE